MSGLIVEMTGIPGSGKTTVAKLLAGELERRDSASWTAKEVKALYVKRVVSPKILVHITMRDPRRMPARREKFQKTDAPRLMRKFQRRFQAGWRIFGSRIEVIRSRDPEQAEMVRRWVKNHALTFMLLRTWRIRFRAYLSEEGVAHRAVNLFVSETGELDRDELRRFLRGWAYPDLLIHVRTDLDRSLERLRGRNATCGMVSFPARTSSSPRPRSNQIREAVHGALRQA